MPSSVEPANQPVTRDAAEAAVNNLYRRLLKDDASPGSVVPRSWTSGAPDRGRSQGWLSEDRAA